jgi:MGT family glycosyltransferase
MKKRFLFSCIGGYGHLHPLVPLARALELAGHEVAFVAGSGMQPLVEKAGFEVFPVPPKRQDDLESIEFKALLATLPISSLEVELLTYNRVFCGIATRLRAPDLLTFAQEWRPDMLIREGGDYSTILVAEKLGLPYATVAFAAALKTMSVFEQDAAARLDPLRAQWGLPPDLELTALYRYLYLAYSPPGFALQPVGAGDLPDSLPDTLHFIRPEIFDTSGDETLPAWMSDLPQQPTVYVTLGTEINGTPEFYPSVLQTIIAGLRELPINLIVTLGRGKDPADFGAQPPNVYIEPYIPQSLLLPHCDLIVMHGGSNTLLAALDVALPMVVVPLIADQFFNAYALENMSLGQVVQWDALTPESIRAAVAEVLQNPVYKQNAARLQAEMHALPAQRHAVELIEQVLADFKKYYVANAGHECSG